MIIVLLIFLLLFIWRKIIGYSSWSIVSSTSFFLTMRFCMGNIKHISSHQRNNSGRVTGGVLSITSSSFNSAKSLLDSSNLAESLDEAIVVGAMVCKFENKTVVIWDLWSICDDWPLTGARRPSLVRALSEPSQIRRMSRMNQSFRMRRWRQTPNANYFLINYHQ